MSKLDAQKYIQDVLEASGQLRYKVPKRVKYLTPQYLASLDGVMYPTKDGKLKLMLSAFNKGIKGLPSAQEAHEKGLTYTQIAQIMDMTNKSMKVLKKFRALSLKRNTYGEVIEMMEEVATEGLYAHAFGGAAFSGWVQGMIKKDKPLRSELGMLEVSFPKKSEFATNRTVFRGFIKGA